ncbi:hypothetical protein [Prevotella sp. HUN102]|uniref:hypothetical protein n=1 Tax=Prevotella sp. HUN102 TaxID=1392486 RepID=UPI0004901DA5|nr:hypothetical protein [Prevotella sp. HUN102]
MTTEQYNALEEELRKKGYGKFKSSYQHEDFGWYKTVLPSNSREDSPPYQIEFAVYDYTEQKNIRRLDDCHNYDVKVFLFIEGSALGLSCRWLSVEEIEKKAESLYRTFEKNIRTPIRDRWI